MMTPKSAAATLALGLALCLLAVAAQAGKKKPDLSKLPPPSDRKDLAYKTHIRPVFDKNCFKCHGPEKQKGKLRLDSLESALKGGEEGKVILPGKSAESPLVINIAHAGDAEDFMPPPEKGPPLSAEEIGLIRAWIDQGAK